MEKKWIVLVAFLLIAQIAVQAQQMTDDAVIEYVLQAQAKGDSESQIARNLLRRGVTMEQINRIKKKYEKQSETGVLGKTLTESSRVRKSPEKGMNGIVELENEKVKTRRMNNTQKEQLMMDEMGFLFPDSALMMQKPEKEIFGHRIFQNKEVSFEASYNLPTPSNYKLGPGDEVIIDIWGASQSTVQETISPDGSIYVENLGPVYLSGRTVKEANAYLKEEFGKIYSGINDQNPNSNINLSLGQNRTIQVHVMGEVTTPGTYAISSFSTVFNALYQAGGVNEIGTLRSVKVYRNNKEIVSYDLYDFILNGNMGKDIRLEDNDAVVVGSYEGLVCITGKVKRPMYYEMRPDENVAKLLEYAGGFVGNAYRENIRLVRMGTREREIYTLNASEQKGFLLMDGDSVSVDSIMPTFSNKVEIRGAVYRPGEFQMDGSVSTVKELIACAGGLRDDAFMNRSLLNRRKPDLTMENLPVNLQGLMDGTVPDIALRKNDVLYISSIFDMQERQVVTIFGEVAFPGTYEYTDNMSLEDFIVAAGGLKEAASTAKVDVARRLKDSKALATNETVSQTFSFSLSDGLVITGEPNFVLKPFDEVYIRKSPGYTKQENVYIDGEVVFSGTYAMTKKNQRLSELVKSSGGLTPEAYTKGARLERMMSEEDKLRLESAIATALQQAKTRKDSISIRQNMSNQISYPVGIELDRALDNPGSEADVVLRPGDRLTIPQFSNTVKLNGEVMYPNTVTYKKGKRLSYYINQAGGYSNDAKKSKVYIVYMNGTVTRAGRLNSTDVQPGCEIIIPKKEESKGMTTAEVMSLGSTSASLATVVLALVNLLR